MPNKYIMALIIWAVSIGYCSFKAFRYGEQRIQSKWDAELVRMEKEKIETAQELTNKAIALKGLLEENAQLVQDLEAAAATDPASPSRVPSAASILRLQKRWGRFAN